MKKKRCTQVKMTNEARVLKQLRVENGFSMMQAGYFLGKSDSYISHLENGRMNLPEDTQIKEILSIYNISYYEFRTRVIKFKYQVSKKEILSSLLEKLEESKIQELINLSETFLTQNSETRRRIA